MTDYVISAVKYADSNNLAGEELYSAKVHIFNNKTKKPFNTKPYEWKREQIIGAMKLGKRFNTYYKCKDSKKFKLGAKIEIFEINGEHYIKTESNDTPCDNISELPVFN